MQQRRQPRPLFFPFLLVLLMLALVGLAGCASVPEWAPALGPSNGAPEDLPLVSPPLGLPGTRGVPVLLPGRGKGCESPPPDEPGVPPT